MTILTCVSCKLPREKGRTLCRICYLDQKRQRAKESYSLNKHSLKRYGFSNCSNCNNQIKLYRKNQTLCKDCHLKRMSIGNNATNNYSRAGGQGYSFLHRRIAENLLKRKLTSNEVIHHIDENTNNNSLDNLMLISRSNHTKLHIFLRNQRAILEQSNIVNQENCWNSFIAPLTTAWLETTGAKVQKLSEISQSAAEPLSD